MRTCDCGLQKNRTRTLAPRRKAAPTQYSSAEPRINASISGHRNQMSESLLHPQVNTPCPHMARNCECNVSYHLYRREGKSTAEMSRRGARQRNDGSEQEWNMRSKREGSENVKISEVADQERHRRQPPLALPYKVPMRRIQTYAYRDRHPLVS
jgi:hypothetical protein